MSYKLIFIVLPLLLCGCADRLNGHIRLADEMQSFRDVHICCKVYGEMMFQPLPVNAETEFAITDTDSGFQFGNDGISRYKSFRLPDDVQDSELVLDSYILIDDSPQGAFNQNSAFFFPKLTFLDGTMMPVGATSPEDIKFYSSLQSDEWNRPSKLEIVVSLKKWPGARYVIVHTSKDQMSRGGEFSVRDPGVTVPAGGSFVTVDSGSGEFHSYGSPVAPNGHLKIRLQAE